MESYRNRASVAFFMVISLMIDAIFAQEFIDMKCNPSIRHRFDACPDGYCCVRDEFLPTYVYCRKIGYEDENCTTKDTESECPCATGLVCKPNIASTFQSLYGRCYNSSKDATTTATIGTTTTTPMVTSDPISSTTTTPMMTSDPISSATTTPMMTSDPTSSTTTTPVMTPDPATTTTPMVTSDPVITTTPTTVPNGSPSPTAADASKKTSLPFEVPIVG